MRAGGWPLPQISMKAAKPSQGRSVLDQDRPSNDMIKVGVRLPQAGLQVEERLSRLAGKVAETTRPAVSTPFWPPITISVRRDAHGLREGRVAVKLCGIEIAD